MITPLFFIFPGNFTHSCYILPSPTQSTSNENTIYTENAKSLRLQNNLLKEFSALRDCMVEAPPFSPGFPCDGQAIVEVSVLWTADRHRFVVDRHPIRIPTFYLEIRIRILLKN
jgi:hypothetical protein